MPGEAVRPRMALHPLRGISRSKDSTIAVVLDHHRGKKKNFCCHHHHYYHRCRHRATTTTVIKATDPTFVPGRHTVVCLSLSPNLLGAFRRLWQQFLFKVEGGVEVSKARRGSLPICFHRVVLSQCRHTTLALQRGNVFIVFFKKTCLLVPLFFWLAILWFCVLYSTSHTADGLVIDTWGTNCCSQLFFVLFLEP